MANGFWRSQILLSYEAFPNHLLLNTVECLQTGYKNLVHQHTKSMNNHLSLWIQCPMSLEASKLSTNEKALFSAETQGGATQLHISLPSHGDQNQSCRVNALTAPKELENMKSALPDHISSDRPCGRFYLVHLLHPHFLLKIYIYLLHHSCEETCQYFCAGQLACLSCVITHDTSNVRIFFSWSRQRRMEFDYPVKRLQANSIREQKFSRWLNTLMTDQYN